MRARREPGTSTKTEADAQATRLAQLQTQIIDLEARVAKASAEGDAQAARQFELQAQTADVESRSTTTRVELANVENRMAVRSQERAEIEEARVQEVQIRQAIARLSQDTDARTVDLAQAEQRLLATRDAEVTAQKALADMRDALDQLFMQRSELEGAIASRNRAVADGEDARWRAARVQEQLAKLTDDAALRNADLASLERQMQEARMQLAEHQAKLSKAQEARAKVTAEGVVVSPSEADRQVPTGALPQ